MSVSGKKTMYRWSLFLAFAMGGFAMAWLRVIGRFMNGESGVMSILIISVISVIVLSAAGWMLREVYSAIFEEAQQ